MIRIGVFLHQEDRPASDIRPRRRGRERRSQPAAVGAFGYRIAAVTRLIAYGVAMEVMAGLSRRDFRWKFPFASTGRSLLAAGAMAGVIIVLRSTDLSAFWDLGSSVPLGILVYGRVLLVLREPEAVSLVDRVLRRRAR